MSIRVTQHTMYNNMVGNMQKNLGAYMESVEQGSSQKRINRPSDDPAGTYRVLTTRVDMTNTEQYQENVDTAKGWLNLADQVLSVSVPTALKGLIGLAEQASTGTYDASQRQIMADQARQYFGQLLNLANTRFEGKTIFSGHKYDESAFDMGLAVTTWDGRKAEAGEESWLKNINDGQLKVDPLAKSDRTIIVEFTSEGEITEASKFRWTNDGGQTWNDGNVTEGSGEAWELNINGVAVTLNKYRQDTNGNYLDSSGKIVDEANKKDAKLAWETTTPPAGEASNAENCTRLYIRPAAYYNGDDKDPPASITVMGDTIKDADGKPASIHPYGDFGKNVLVRIDGNKDGKNVDPGEALSYSYSTDGGSTWISQLSATLDNNGNVRLPVPGGYMEITGATELPKDSQIMIHPSRADLKYEIMKDTFLEVNSVGKDVFGGWYEGKSALDGDNNLFEVVGSFIGYLEGNNQQGCQETLAALKVAEKQVLAEATRIGGMENRIEMASDLLSYEKIDQQERLSFVEDIDLTELLTKLTRQQLTYQTVLQSSSMIMQLSLAKYV